MTQTQFWTWAIGLAPLLFAFAVSTNPAGGMIVGGIVLMYAGYVGAALLPFLGVVAGAQLFIGGALLAGLGGATGIIIDRLGSGPTRTAKEIDRILTERAGAFDLLGDHLAGACFQLLARGRSVAERLLFCFCSLDGLPHGHQSACRRLAAAQAHGDRLCRLEGSQTPFSVFAAALRELRFGSVAGDAICTKAAFGARRQSFAVGSVLRKLGKLWSR